MSLRSLDHVLGTAAKVRLLRTLVGIRDSVSAREAGRLTGLSHRAARLALEDLTRVGLLTVQRTPSAHLYRVNRRHDLLPAIRALFQAEDRRTRLIGKELELPLVERDLREEVMAAVLYGSVARGEDRPDSDLDILIVVRDAAKVTDVEAALGVAEERLRERYGLRVAPVVLSLERLRELHERNAPIAVGVVRDGRTLFGQRVQELVGEW